MIEETLRRIENAVADNTSLEQERKEELLALVTHLKEEIGSLDTSHNDAAGSIARYAEFSIREAVKKEPDRELLNHSIQGLLLSVRRFEISHPSLMGTINSIGQTLNSIGI